MSIVDRINEILSDPDNREAIATLIAWVKGLFRRKT